MHGSVLDLASEFDLGDRAYLDGANHGPMPRRSLAAACAALDWKRDPATLDDRLYFELPDRIRRAGAALLGCATDDVAIASGASHGISLVACGLEWASGDHVLVPHGEFPANSLPWMALRARGVDVEFVDVDRLLEAIRPETRVVSVGHVNFATGRRLDIDAIGARCAQHDTLFVVDAAQSLGAIPFDAVRCQAAVVAVAGYKWLMSPYGTGLTYVHPARVDQFRMPVFNWATIVGADDFNQLVDLVPRHRPGAIRFDVPETAAFVNGAAMAESLELLLEVGVDRGFRHSKALVNRLIDNLPSGFALDSPLNPEARSTIVRIVALEPEMTLAAHELLGEHGVAVSLRESGLRVAPGIWSTTADIDRLLECLHAVARKR